MYAYHPIECATQVVIIVSSSRHHHYITFALGQNDAESLILMHPDKEAQVDG